MCSEEGGEECVVRREEKIGRASCRERVLVAV